MRELINDLAWLTKAQNRKDLSDDYLREKCETTRDFYADNAFDFDYGITFVESDIAREWLERAIKAEELLNSKEGEG